MPSMKRPVHAATVEDVDLPVDAPFCAGDPAFRAVCLVSGAACDAWGFVEVDGPHAILEPGEGAAINRALSYLGDRTLHEEGSAAFCNADHVMGHDVEEVTRG